MPNGVDIPAILRAMVVLSDNVKPLNAGFHFLTCLEERYGYFLSDNLQSTT